MEFTHNILNSDIPLKAPGAIVSNSVKFRICLKLKIVSLFGLTRFEKKIEKKTCEHETILNDSNIN